MSASGFTDEQKQLLEDLAEIASREIASRLPTEARMQPPGRLSYLLDLLPVGLYISYCRGRLVYYNRLAQEIWGSRVALGTPDTEAFLAEAAVHTRTEFRSTTAPRH